MLRRETLWFLLGVVVVAVSLLFIFTKPLAIAQSTSKVIVKEIKKEWYPTAQATYAWDRPSLVDGSAVPANELKYQPYLKKEGGQPEIYGGEISAEQVTVTFTVEGRYRCCVQAIRYPTDSNERLPTTISCSDQVEVVKDGIVWGVVYYVPVLPPKGLRLAQ